MFSQLVFVRLRAAEKALREGRLDEAFRLATATDLKDQRRAADVRQALADKFLERAREHFRADRFREALADLDKAAAGHVLHDAIAELRNHVTTVFTAMNASEQSQRARLDEARRRMESGSLAAGQRILQAAPVENAEADRLRLQMQHRAADVDDIAVQAQRLIKDGQFAPAAERIRRAKAIDVHHEKTIRLETDFCAAVFERVRASLTEGRLGRAADELACLGSLGTHIPTKRELSDMLGLAHQAGRSVEGDQYADARRHLLSLQRLLPNAKWVAKSLEQLHEMEELRTAVRAGPLGERIPAVAAPLVRPPEDRRLDDTVAVRARVPMRDRIMEQLLLLVDGGGSYLILRGSSASVGRVAAERPADIPLYCDLAERHANVTRVEDDYFLFSDKDVEVGGLRAVRHLLRDGDRIVLGRKAKLTFSMPSRQSATAVLDLSDSSKMPQDVRRIVLLDRHAMIGNSAKAHIRCRHAASMLVLFERDGQLWVRPRNDGHPAIEAKQLRLGEQTDIAGVSLTLSPWQIRPMGSTNA